jgi:hypothetical protein
LRFLIAGCFALKSVVNRAEWLLAHVNLSPRLRETFGDLRW